MSDQPKYCRHCEAYHADDTPHLDESRKSELASSAGSPVFSALRTVPRAPWVASQQYGFRFILSQDNEILFKCGKLPMPLIQAITDAANKWIKENL